MPQDIIPTVATEAIPADIFHPTWQEEESRGWGSARQVLFLVFKWRWLILSLSLVFTIAAAIAMYLKPLVRTATAEVLLKGDRLPLQISDLTSAASTRQPYSLQILESEIELLKSRGVLLPAAKRLVSQHGEPEGGPSEEEELEDKADSLQNRMTAVAVPDTNVIQVSYSAPTAEEAVKTLSVILDQYQEHHTMAHSGSTELMKFYEQEKARVGTDLQSAEEQLRKWQEASNIVSVDEQIKSLIDMRADQEAALQRTEAEMARLSHQDPLVTRLKSDLATATVALQALLQRYTDEDRRVQEKKEQIALIKQELASAEQSLRTSMAAEQETLRKQIRETTAALIALREKKLGVTRLSRLVDLHQDAFLLYGKKVEEARIASGLDNAQLSNIAMIEQPYAPPDTDLKKRIAIVILAAIMGLTLGVIIALGLALLNTSFNMEEDVEHYLRLPVLAVIPDLRRSVSP